MRIAVHHPIIALQEKVFKPLIKSAYYNSSTFHFDLTTAEALRLLDAFTHRQVNISLDSNMLSQPLGLVMHQASSKM